MGSESIKGILSSYLHVTHSIESNLWPSLQAPEGWRGPIKQKNRNQKPLQNELSGSDFGMSMLVGLQE